MDNLGSRLLSSFGGRSILTTRFLSLGNLRRKSRCKWNGMGHGMCIIIGVLAFVWVVYTMASASFFAFLHSMRV
jgi:hypothetical protein